MKKILNELVLKEEGQGMVEYGLIISLVILAAVGAVELFGGGLESMYEDIKSIVLEALA